MSEVVKLEALCWLDVERNHLNRPARGRNQHELRRPVTYRQRKKYKSPETSSLQRITIVCINHIFVILSQAILRCDTSKYSDDKKITFYLKFCRDARSAQIQDGQSP